MEIIQSMELKEKVTEKKENNIKSKTECTFGKLRLRNPAPEFRTKALIHNSIRDISLSDYRGKYVLLVFYPGDFTFVCPTELHAFSDRAQEFRNIGCEVLACSTDSVYVHLAFVGTPRKAGGLDEVDVPLLADGSLRISRDYGVLDEMTGASERGLFIIDRQGLLRQVTINDAAVGRSVDEALRLIQAFQYTDEFGELCPVNWRPGHRTLKAEAQSKDEYFKRAM